jgi:DNA replicative helicase MCM subunit Mcm2 (Cdc46/Mcm family)
MEWYLVKGQIMELYVPRIDVDTRYYPAPLEGFYRVSVICKNCQNEFMVDIKKKVRVKRYLDKVECPNCEICEAKVKIDFELKIDDDEI